MRKITLLLVFVGFCTSLLWTQSVNLPALTSPQKETLWIWGEHGASSSGGRIFVWTDGKVLNLTPAGQNWRVMGSRTTKSQVDVWGVLKTPQGDKVWQKKLKLSSEVKPTLRGAEFFSQT